MVKQSIGEQRTSLTFFRGIFWPPIKRQKSSMWSNIESGCVEWRAVGIKQGGYLCKLYELHCSSTQSVPFPWISVMSCRHSVAKSSEWWCRWNGTEEQKYNKRQEKQITTVKIKRNQWPVSSNSGTPPPQQITIPHTREEKKESKSEQQKE